MITYTEVRNPVWLNAEQTLIGVEVNFDHLPEYEWIEFGAYLFDTEPHGVEIFNRAAAGEFGPVAEYVEPEEEAE